VKLRAFGLTQYDAVLLVDSNAFVAGDVAPLFALPTDFAAGWDQARWLRGNDTAAVRAVSGGALFLRPCAATEAHLLDLLARGERGGKGGAGGGDGGGLPTGGGRGTEQELLSWCASSLLGDPRLTVTAVSCRPVGCRAPWPSPLLICTHQRSRSRRRRRPTRSPSTCSTSHRSAPRIALSVPQVL
jgi:hypothetical protein